METAEITKTKKLPSFNQVIKAIKKYAAEHGQRKYIQVNQEYDLYEGGKEKRIFKAYISDFGIFATGDNIPDLIRQFDAVLSTVPPPVSNEIDLAF